MIELKIFEETPERVVQSLKKRQIPEAEAKVDHVLQLNRDRKNIQQQVDEKKAESNRASKEIGKLFREGATTEANAKKEEVGSLKTTIKELESQQRSVLEQLDELLFDLPNVLHEDVPGGKSDEDNEIVRPHAGELPTLPDNALPHWELAKECGILDMELGAKISGSGFPVLLGKGARLQRALISFFLDKATEKGYREVVPPLLVNEDSARGTGQLPDKEGQMYQIPKDELYLIPTAEVPLTNMYRDVILQEKDLPIQITGYTPCFRREAGSYGSEVKGLNRVHQFDKVEIVRIEHPERSYAALDEMMEHVSALLEALELPYRVLRLCGGDTGFAAAMTYDFEVYSAAQKKWLEVSSVSNFETFQSHRMQLRFKGENGNQLAHTLNGSALALARILASLIENGQSPEGIHIPKALVPYTGFDLISNS